MFGMAAAALGGALLGSRSSRSSQPSAPERMSYEDAYEQAEDALTPHFEKDRQRVWDDISRNMVASGFYGQAPGDSLRTQAMTDMQSDFSGQKSRYAQNLRSTEYAEDYRRYQHELQQRDDRFGSIGTGAALGYQVGGGWGAAIGALTGAFF